MVIKLTKKVHTTAGICTGIIFSIILFKKNILHFDTIILFILLSGAAIGSIIPDIDNRRSHIGQRAKKISKAINKYGGHRGITHSILGLIIAYLLLSIVGNYTKLINFIYYKVFSLGVLIGYISHLIFDIITVGGIPLFYPIKKRFRFFYLKSDKFQNLISAICIIITIFILIQMNYSFILTLFQNHKS